MTKNGQRIYRDDFDGQSPSSEPLRLANTPPPWRQFASDKPVVGDFTAREMPVPQSLRGERFKPTKHEAQMINAALVLRRPLLIEGEPGVGKTSLAYSVAWQLGLGEVLRWPITSRSILQEALYQYDAIARLQAVSLNKNGNGKMVTDIGEFLTLGPVGTALLPNGDGPYHPRVLLVDEIDKSDIDLPNDLLHVLEEGFYEIREIARLKSGQPCNVRQYRSLHTAPIPSDGRVQCDDFPLVIMTTNGEREFSTAFRRRCLTLRITRPDETKLQEILTSHLNDQGTSEDAKKLLSEFLNRLGQQDQLAVDQLLNAVYLTTSDADVNPNRHPELLDAVMSSLSGSTFQG